MHVTAFLAFRADILTVRPQTGQLVQLAASLSAERRLKATETDASGAYMREHFANTLRDVEWRIPGRPADAIGFASVFSYTRLPWNHLGERNYDRVVFV